MVFETELYDILEVSTTCSDSEIRKSYRRLCLIHHPDKAAKGSDPSTFLSIQQAYETLSDPDKRAAYDEFGADGDERGGGGPNVDDFFASMFGMGGGMGGMGGGGGAGGRGQRKRRKEKSDPSVVSMNVTLEDLYLGKTKSCDAKRSRVCTTCKGSGAKPKAKPRACYNCQGAGMIYQMRHMGAFVQRVPMSCTECDGAGSKFRAQDLCKKCFGSRTVSEKKRIEVIIERGAHPGDRIVLSGEGDEDPDCSSPGDLYINLTLLPHPTFTHLASPSPRSPSSLSTTLSLNLSESLLGFSRLILVHLDGRGLRVTQPGPGEKGWRVLKTGDEVVVKGEGMVRAGQRGDLRLRVEVETPTEEWAGRLTKEQIDALTGLLPPKRMDMINPTETDDVELVDAPAPSSSRSREPRGRGRRAYESDGEEESMGAGPSCHQQ